MQQASAWQRCFFFEVSKDQVDIVLSLLFGFVDSGAEEGLFILVQNSHLQLRLLWTALECGMLWQLGGHVDDSTIRRNLN